MAAVGSSCSIRTFTWWDLAEKARAGGNQNCPRLYTVSRGPEMNLIATFTHPFACSDRFVPLP